MLRPDSRRVLLEALRPPDGYVVDRAIATTYTLDLTALLIAPLAFAMLDGLCSRAKPTAPHVADSIDPFALLKAVRGSSERTTVFCQADDEPRRVEISIALYSPGAGQGGDVLAELEDLALASNIDSFAATVMPTHPAREKISAWLKENDFQEELPDFVPVAEGDPCSRFLKQLTSCRLR